MPERSPTIAGRASGVLLHPTSLPGPGTGDLGEHAFRFTEWLARAEQSLWQVLPLVAVNEGGSPYNALSAFAGNPLLISPAELHLHGLLPEDAVHPPKGLDDDEVDFPAVSRWKADVVRRAYETYRGADDEELRADFAAFADENQSWLDDWSLFAALRERHDGAGWMHWPEPLRARDAAALAEARRELADDVERHAYAQYLFDLQWTAVRRAANRAGIQIVGDVPIFVAHDSADVWANQGLFTLDDEGQPTVVSGVPPDYFSETGQRWGNPLYRWELMAKDGYRWWVERFRRTLAMVDVVRIDHFRGFESYWEVPGEEETAINGQWLPGPGRDLFAALERELGALPLIAEDLGIITEEVEELRDGLGLPGMRVLQFAFGGDDPKNPHLPGNYVHNAVAYTGTHDNDTALGWYADVDGDERAALQKMAGGDRDMNWRMIRTVLESEAGWAVVPLQDVLGLGGQARMNTPGVAEGNWAWRFDGAQLTPQLADRLAELVRASRRAPDPRVPVGLAADETVDADADGEVD